MKYLVIGGAGYIGSHMVQLLQEKGHTPVVYDNFSTGNIWANKDCKIIKGDLLDKKKLSSCLANSNYDAIFHFAAKSIVSESEENPYFYYQNNVLGTMNLLNEMVKNNINNLIFSSTAAVYGIPTTKKINEDHPTNPINVYGATKLAVENLIKDYCRTKRINGICFRYFNAAGAHSSGIIGEIRPFETHLIPNILISSTLKKNNLKVYGNDYNTTDGSCIRDYIHVEDIADSHLIGAEKINELKGFHVFNIGTEIGFSVFEIIKACVKVIGTEINYQIVKRRMGDPDSLIADCKKAKTLLNWKPKYKDILEITKSAHKFYKHYLKN